MAVGRDPAAETAEEERDRYVSFRILDSLGSSTGRPLMKKNCRSPADLEEPATAFET